MYPKTCTVLASVNDKHLLMQSLQKKLSVGFGLVFVCLFVCLFVFHVYQIVKRVTRIKTGVWGSILFGQGETQT